MSEDKIIFHPALADVLTTFQKAKEINECVKMDMIISREIFRLITDEKTFERIKQIVEQEELRKQAAFYDTISEAMRAGYDFSQVESLKDIADIYAKYLVNKVFGREN